MTHMVFMELSELSSISTEKICDFKSAHKATFSESPKTLLITNCNFVCVIFKFLAGNASSKKSDTTNGTYLYAKFYALP